MKNQPMSFGEAISYSVGKTNSEIDKKYKGEKRTKAKEALNYAQEWLSTRPVGFNLGDSQEKLRDECEEYVKAKFQGPARMDSNGQPVGFFILGAILMGIIGFIVRKLLQHMWDNWAV